MKKKIFTFMALLLGVVSGAWADDAVLYWAEGTTTANSITVNEFTIAISGNTQKSWASGNGVITLGNTAYQTLKNSNGAQNTITCPSGKVATKIVFYAVTNDGSTHGILSEIDGTSCNDEVSSLKDYTNYTTITKTINSKASFTFTFKEKQVCFVAVVTYTDAAIDVVSNPSINQTGNKVTMNCNTTGAKVYYTTDGMEPTTSSTLYSSEITLPNPCTIRAKAFNGSENQYSSEIVKRDCIFDHVDALTLIGSDTGSMNETNNVWTGTDGMFTLTNNVDGREITNASGLSHGLKLNHTDIYTLQPSADVKVTKIVVVGKSWLQADGGNNASTIAFDGFTPESGAFYEYPTGGETYVKTIEFTPSAEQDFGQAITMRPRTNQLGAYIEVYGIKRTGPADATEGVAITETVTFEGKKVNSVRTPEDAASIITANSNWKEDINVGGYTVGEKLNSSGWIAINLPAKACDISLELLANGNPTLKLDGTVESDATWTGDATKGYSRTISIDDSYAGKEYKIEKGSAEVAIVKVILSYSIGRVGDIYLTTTANMAGWRAFYGGEQSYKVDDNTTVYVATAADEKKVTLAKITDVPAGMPVILKTTADDYTMTLTKDDNVVAPNIINQLKVTTAGQALGDGVYRLGYSPAGGVGFYPFSTTSATAGIIYVEVAGEGSRGLQLAFNSDITGISSVNTESKAVIARKVMRDGRIVVETQKGMFNLSGTQLR